jgi:cell division protein FtsN
MREMYMKLRFYMRGLGIGMMVTALLVTIVSHSGGASGQLSDEEIKARAAELGMVEERAVVLSDLIDTSNDKTAAEETQNPESTQASDNTQNNESTEQESEPATTTESAEQESEPVSTTESIAQESESASTTESTAQESESASTTESTAQETAADNAQNAEVSFRISSGSSSGMVSRNLVEAGLVEDAVAFDQFLCDNGYSKALRVGNYEIPQGSSYEEIAKIITGKR